MKVFNTLSRQKEEFLPSGDEVKIYVCGVTPYDDAHIGHAMSYIFFDVIRRYLQFQNKYKVKYVQNVTDIDDKIIDRASKLGKSPAKLAQEFTDSFFGDMDALNIKRADIYPKATEEIPKIIEVIQGLVDKDYAYPAGGSVYFRVRNVSDYGKLAHRTLDDMMAGARIEPGEEKEHPMDFVLWKASKPGEPSWESPWGQGRPGWHIECSAMSLKYLGEQIDIHGGGQDLIFPHHENEIAQSESFTGKKPFVKYWMHNGLLQLGAEKMSKSLGNLITIREALQKYSADAIRIFVLSSHYRSPLTYSEEALGAAEGGTERLQRAISRYEPNSTGTPLDAEPYRQRFIEVMDDDFNTPQALGVLFDLAREINQAVDSGANCRDAKKVLATLAGEVTGLTFRPKAQRISGVGGIPSGEAFGTPGITQSISGAGGIPSGEVFGTIGGTIATRVSRLIEEREKCRKGKKWQLADEIRQKLAKLGVTLEDTKMGTDIIYTRAPSEEALESLMRELGIDS